MIEQKVNRLIKDFLRLNLNWNLDTVSQDKYICRIEDWKWADSDWGFNLGRGMDRLLGPVSWGDGDEFDPKFTPEQINMGIKVLRLVKEIQLVLVAASEAECFTSESEYIREFKKNQKDFGYD